jgi:hypothetical protein
MAGPEEAKNPAGKSPPPDSDPFSDAELGKNLAFSSSTIAATANRFQFEKRSQHFVRTHNETLFVAMQRLGQSARAFGINGCKIKRHG